MPPVPTTVAEGATVERIYTGDERLMMEGPVWNAAGGALLFTACRADQIWRIGDAGDAALWMEPTGGINGMFLARDGRVLGAAVSSHEVVSIGLGPDGPTDRRVLAANASWNQPNDVCESPTGHLYFSDPSWSDPARSAVYHLSPSGEVTRVVTDMEIPNGLIVSLDGRELIVGDSNRKHWRAYPISEDGSLGEGREFFNPDTPNQDDPDGMTLDEDGNLYLTGRGGVWVVTPAGESLGLIRTPAFVSNVGFGGAEGRTLFLTGRGAVWRLAMNTRGFDFGR